MSGARVGAVVVKEMQEMRRNRLLVVTMLLPALALTVLPLIVLRVLRAVPQRPMSPDEVSGLLALAPQLTSFSAEELLQVFLARTFLTIFLILPLILPLTIAAHSIIGEKQMRSLEPLLATPIRTGELLLGKSLSAMAPAVVATWLAYLLFFAVAPWVVTGRVYQALLDPMWLAAALLLAPLLSLLSVSCGVVISSRVNDTRAAQNTGGLLVLPVVALLGGQALGWVLLDYRLMLAGCLLVALIDAGVLWVGVLLFDRETILTRWK